MKYGIPWDYMTPDVFGEKFGSGRVPGGTRGYTWADWQTWLAPDNPTEDMTAQQKLYVMLGSSLVVLGVLAALYMKSREE